MPEYQLPIAGVLAVTAVGSLVVLYFERSSGGGKIQLPTHGEEDSLLRDPFDVTRPEDAIDGYPIDEGEFWNKACTHWRGLFLTLIRLLLGPTMETFHMFPARYCRRVAVHKSRLDIHRR